MATKVKAKTKNGLVEGGMTYDKDSTKKTFHRYQVKAEIKGVDKDIVGTLYIPYGHAGKVKELHLTKITD